MKFWLLAASVAVLAILVLAWWWRKEPMPPAPPEAASGLPDTCRELSFEGVPHIDCEVSSDKCDLVLRRADAAGKPYRDLAKLAAAEPFVFAVNAGMYHEDFTPVGLHVEGGREDARSTSMTPKAIFS